MWRAMPMPCSSRLQRSSPRPWGPDRAKLLARLKTSFNAATSLHVVWLSDGLDQASATAFAEGLTGLAGGNAQVDAVMPNATALPHGLCGTDN